MINCVGGMPVLLPILEQLALVTPEQHASDPTGSDLITPDVATPAEGDWVILPSNRASGLFLDCDKESLPRKLHVDTNALMFSVFPEARLENNLVATFLLVLKHFLQRHLINQESLLHSHGVATLGALLQKVSVKTSLSQDSYSLVVRDALIMSNTHNRRL